MQMWYPMTCSCYRSEVRITDDWFKLVRVDAFFFQLMCLLFIYWFLRADQSSSSVAPAVKLGSCLSMDGRRHENGQSWHDGCRDCYCHAGREMCALISCPVPPCDNPTIRPGHCCPTCPGEPTLQHTCITISIDTSRWILHVKLFIISFRRVQFP